VVAYLRKTRRTVVRGKANSMAFRELLMELWRTLSTLLFEVLGRPDDLPLHKQPISLKI